MAIVNYLWNEIQEQPFKVGILSSSGSVGVYLLQFLTDERVMKVAAGLAMFFGLVLTILSIWLTVIRIMKESKEKGGN